MLQYAVVHSGIWSISLFLRNVGIVFFSSRFTHWHSGWITFFSESRLSQVHLRRLSDLGIVWRRWLERKTEPNLFMDLRNHNGSQFFTVWIYHANQPGCIGKYTIVSWILWLFQEISNERTHWTDPEKTWVSNSSIATYQHGSVGKVPFNFWWNGELFLVLGWVQHMVQQMLKWCFVRREVIYGLGFDLKSSGTRRSSKVRHLLKTAGTPNLRSFHKFPFHHSQQSCCEGDIPTESINFIDHEMPQPQPFKFGSTMVRLMVEVVLMQRIWRRF